MGVYQRSTRAKGQEIIKKRRERAAPAIPTRWERKYPPTRLPRPPVTGQQPGSKHRLGPCSQPGYLNRQCCSTLVQYGCRRDSRRRRLDLLTRDFQHKLDIIQLSSVLVLATSQQTCVLHACVNAIRPVKCFFLHLWNSCCFGIFPVDDMQRWTLWRRSRYVLINLNKLRSQLPPLDNRVNWFKVYLYKWRYFDNNRLTLCGLRSR